jgi:hypothetical protein
MKHYPPITNDQDLAVAILMLWQDGKYDPIYHSFKGDVVPINENWDVLNAVGEILDENDEEWRCTKLEHLGSNLVTDAMDVCQGEGGDEKWENMEMVEVLRAIDKYVHKPE